MNTKIKRTLAVFMLVLTVLTSMPFGSFAGLDFGAKAQAASLKQGQIVTLGSYPQTKVTDEKLISSLNAVNGKWISYGYYYADAEDDLNGKPRDFMKYKDVSFGGKRYRAVVFSSYRPSFTNNEKVTKTEVGDFRTFQDENGYYPNNVYWFKFEPLKWKVLDPKTGLMLSESIIDSQPLQNESFLNYTFDPVADDWENSDHDCFADPQFKHYASDYGYTSIRKWLNNDFYNIAFSDSEKGKVGETTVENKGGNSKYDAKPTKEKVFLLSKDDVFNSAYGFKREPTKSSSEADWLDDARVSYGSDYAKCQGLSVQGETTYDGEANECVGQADWRLRTPGIEFAGEAYNVLAGGYVDDFYQDINNTTTGIRPALTMSVHTHKTVKTVAKATEAKNGKVVEKCTSCGAIVSSTVIAKVSKISLESASLTYTGKVKTPKVIVKDSKGKALKAGTDYTLTYSNKSSKSIGKYTVKVTLKGKYSGTKTLTYSIAPAKIAKLTVKQSTSTVKVSWNAVKGAAGYRVFLYNTKTKKYVKLADTTKTSFTIKKLKAGTAYKIAVRPYGKSGKTVIWAAKYTAITTATKPATPKLAVKAGAKKAALKWNKQVCTGYQIYYSTKKNGTYKKLTTVKNAKTVSYTAKKLKTGSAVYFKVRAYRKVGSANVFGAFSAVKGVKIK